MAVRKRRSQKGIKLSDALIGLNNEILKDVYMEPKGNYVKKGRLLTS
jgi:hypothetical protein